MQARGGTRRNHPICSRGEPLTGKREREGPGSSTVRCEQGFGSVQHRCLEWGCEYTSAGVPSLKGQVQSDSSVS